MLFFTTCFLWIVTSHLRDHFGTDEVYKDCMLWTVEFHPIQSNFTRYTLMKSSNSPTWQFSPGVSCLTDQCLSDKSTFSQELSEVMQYVVIMTNIFPWSLPLIRCQCHMTYLPGCYNVPESHLSFHPKAANNTQLSESSQHHVSLLAEDSLAQVYVW